MPLIDDTVMDVGDGAERPADRRVTAKSDLRFIPADLASNCRRLIVGYHEIHGYGRLADMLWHSDARDIIECDRDLANIFKKASKSRCAKLANDSLLLIATVIVSLEVLARDFAGWGKRFPAAKRAAEEMLIDFPLRHRTWFMDEYLYPSLDARREFASALDSNRAQPSR